ncbi:hypothetical protein [Aeribacillus pallidus]
MKFLVRDWLKLSEEERFWILENEAFRQWKNRKNKTALRTENR